MNDATVEIELGRRKGVVGERIRCTQPPRRRQATKNSGQGKGQGQGVGVGVDLGVGYR